MSSSDESPPPLTQSSDEDPQPQHLEVSSGSTSDDSLAPLLAALKSCHPDTKDQEQKKAWQARKQARWEKKEAKKKARKLAKQVASTASGRPGGASSCTTASRRPGSASGASSSTICTTIDSMDKTKYAQPWASQHPSSADEGVVAVQGSSGGSSSSNTVSECATTMSSSIAGGATSSNHGENSSKASSKHKGTGNKRC